MSNVYIVATYDEGKLQSYSYRKGKQTALNEKKVFEDNGINIRVFVAEVGEWKEVEDE